MIEALGYVSGLSLAICGLPQAIQSWRTGNSQGISPYFLWLWGLGEVGMTIYTLLKIGFDKPLLLNYIFNIVLIIFIMRYYYFPRRVND